MNVTLNTIDFMDLSDTGPRVRQLSHFWGGGGKEEWATSQYSVMLWLTFLVYRLLKSDTFLSSANPWL